MPENPRPEGGEGNPQLREQMRRFSPSLPSTHLRIREKSGPVSLSPAPSAPVEPSTDFLSIKRALHQRLLEDLERRGLLGNAEEKELRAAIERFVSDVVDRESVPMNRSERQELASQLAEEILGVGPLAPLMADPAVTDILVNRPDRVYVERFGRLEKTPIRFQDEDHLFRLIQRIVSSVGRRIDESSPYVDARLPDGSRVNATIPPISVDGPTLSIRRFGRNRMSMEEMVRLGTLSADMVRFLDLAVRGRRSLAISGGTGAGKSTFLGAVARFIPKTERLITIEDTVELVLDQEHVIRCETRASNMEGQGAVTARDLLRNALRMRPDRIIIGEVRGSEAFDMLQAMNTGHEGSMTTLHANSPRDALARLESMVLMAGADLPSRAIREQFVSALSLLVHIERHEDGVRRVTRVVELVGMEGDVPQTQEIFRFVRLGNQGGRLLGRFEATGIVPRMTEDLKARGIDVPVALFARAPGS